MEIYVKEETGQSRIVYSKADKVAAVFDGFRPKIGEDTPYRDLQAEAKEQGVPANQSREELLAALAGDVDTLENEQE